jgi:hypothetical protein
MKKTLITTMILVIIMSFFVSCAVERSIEQTINDFATASNTNDLDLLNGLLSENSQFWGGRPTTVEGLLDYMYFVAPVSFNVPPVIATSDEVNVYATAVYDFIGPTSFDVYFVMRLHDKEWKIKEYWDYIIIDPEEDNDYVWLKLGRPEIIH